jgi:hypothetical protein
MCKWRVYVARYFDVISTVTYGSYIVQGSIRIHMYAIQWRMKFVSLSSGDALSEFCGLNAAFLITLLTFDVQYISAWIAYLKDSWHACT